MRRALLSVLLVFLGAVSIPAPGTLPASVIDDRPGRLEKLFADPPLEARPGVLWTWMNGHVDNDQLERELREMKDKGLRGAIIWDLGSLSDPEKIIPAGPAFLGEESLASIRRAMDVAAELGLELGISAASSWNAGGPWIGPQDASRALLWSETRIEGPQRFEGILPLPKGTGTPHQDVAVVGITGTKGKTDPAPGEVLDLTRFLDGTGRLRWDAPPGDWTVLRFVAHNTGQRLECPSPHSQGLVIDHLSRRAVDRHLAFMLDRLKQGRSDFGPLKYFFFDSYEVQEGTDWTDDWLAAFRSAYGYDPRPYFPVLAGKTVGNPDLTARFRHDLLKHSSDLIIDNHYRRAAEILHKEGLQVIAEAGHGGSARVDVLKALGAADYPMGEFWNHERFWVTKEAASAAHIYSKRFVPAESLTGWRHWQDGPLAYKRLVDIAFCAGLNQVTFHTFAHNPPEAGRPGFAYHAGEHLNVNSTWWNFARPLMDYLARCSALLQQGLFVADVCLYYGDQAPNLVPARRIDPAVKPRADAATQCLHCGAPLPVRVDTLGPGYDYDYVNEEILVDRMRVESGRLVLPDGMSYRLLVLPDRPDISPAVLKKVEALVREGAVVVGPRPQRSNSLAGYPDCDRQVEEIAARVWGPTGPKTASSRAYGRGRIIRNRPLREVLGEMGIGPDFTVRDTPNQDRHIDYIHRRTADEDIYFVSNSALEPATVSCTFRVEPGRTPALWDPADGAITPCREYERTPDGLRLSLTLPAVGSIFVVFKKDGRPDQSRVKTPPSSDDVPSSAIRLNEPWTLSFPENRGAPPSVSLKTLGSWTASADPGIKFFSGTAEYANTFDLPEPPQKSGLYLSLELCEVKEVAEVFVNGRSAGILWKPPFRADITGLVKGGRNALKIAVANLWNNRIVGDLQPGAKTAYTRTNLKNKFKAGSPLIESGLLGPVRLAYGRGPAKEEWP